MPFAIHECMSGGCYSVPIFMNRILLIFFLLFNFSWSINFFYVFELPFRHSILLHRYSKVEIILKKRNHRLIVIQIFISYHSFFLFDSRFWLLLFVVGQYIPVFMVNRLLVIQMFIFPVQIPFRSSSYVFVILCRILYLSLFVQIDSWPFTPFYRNSKIVHCWTVCFFYSWLILLQEQWMHDLLKQMQFVKGVYT